MAYLIRKLKFNCFLHISTKLVLKWSCEGLAAILTKVNTKMCTLTTQLILLIWMKYNTGYLKLAIASWNRPKGHLLGYIETFSFILCFPLWNLKKKQQKTKLPIDSVIEDELPPIRQWIHTERIQCKIIYSL